MVSFGLSRFEKWDEDKRMGRIGGVNEVDTDRGGGLEVEWQFHECERN